MSRKRGFGRGALLIPSSDEVGGQWESDKTANRPSLGRGAHLNLRKDVGRSGPTHSEHDDRFEDAEGDDGDVTTIYVASRCCGRIIGIDYYN